MDEPRRLAQPSLPRGVLLLEDCTTRRPTLIAVGMDDIIVAPREIAERFGTWQSRLAGVRVLTMDGIGHGGWIEDDPAQGDRLVAAVRDLRREVANIGRLEELPRRGAEAFRGVVTPTRIVATGRGVESGSPAEPQANEGP